VALQVQQASYKAQEAVKTYKTTLENSISGEDSEFNSIFSKTVEDANALTSAINGGADADGNATTGAKDAVEKYGQSAQ
jgi:phage-related protein